MFDSKSRVVLLTVLTVVSVAACAQQPAQVQPQNQTQPVPLGVTIPAQGQAPVVMSPVLPEEQMERFRRRDEASVDIEAVIAEVAASTGKEFLVDPRVRARVFAVPALEDPTYETLLAVLRLHGYIALDVGGKINVLPDANARSMPTRVLQGDDSSVPDDELITRVITVPGNNAANLVPILRPLLPQAAHLAALVEGEENNKLIIVDTYANVRRIAELVQTLGR
jgi:type II secretory pathway component GspD/PulD (secretin)